MKTAIATELKKLRAECGERLLEMSARLEVSVAFLSAIETGRKEAPLGIADKIVSAYDLKGEAAERITDAVYQTRTSFKLEPKSPVALNTTALLARKLDSLSNDKLLAIRSILDAEEGD